MDADGDGTVTKEEFEVWWTEWSKLMAEDAPAAPVATSAAPAATSTDANAFEADELQELLADMSEADAAEALQEIGIDAVRRLSLSVRRVRPAPGDREHDGGVRGRRPATSRSRQCALRSRPTTPRAGASRCGPRPIALRPTRHGFHRQRWPPAAVG